MSERVMVGYPWSAVKDRGWVGVTPTAGSGSRAKVQSEAVSVQMLLRRLRVCGQTEVQCCDLSRT